MNRYYYDFHLHSCLSPCADNDMTPNNIAGMATLCNLQIVALTDHNTAKNCPAFFAAAKRHGLIPVAGMELTTAEDIHVVCLFERLDDAMRFDAAIDSRRIRIPNRVDIFGDQLVMNSEDEVIATEGDLLSNATTVSIDEAPALVHAFDGVCIAAHVDREANGILSVLGAFPENTGFDAVELHDPARREMLCQRYASLSQMRFTTGSDAHYLWEIREAESFFDLEDEPYSSDLVRTRLFQLLKGEDR